MAQLNRRKCAARDKAGEEKEAREVLDGAMAAYEAATAGRLAAKLALAEALQAEDAAAAKVQEAVRAVEARAARTAT